MKRLRPNVVINFKNISGNEAVKLAMELEQVDQKLLSEYNVSLAVQPMDLFNILTCCDFNLFVQDIYSSKETDIIYFLKNYIPNRKVRGTILNHPEKKIPMKTVNHLLQQTVELGLESIVCACNLAEAKEMFRLKPTYICIENENLIGKNDSFTNHCPEIVSEARKEISSGILIGAGVRTNSEIKYVTTHNGSGVIVSSVVVKSSNPTLALNSLLSN